MAEIWYLEVDTDSLDDKEKHEIPFEECIELLEIRPDGWHAEGDTLPELLTGDPFVDGSGRIYLCLRVSEDELEAFQDKRWKPGWYKSGVTIVGYENKLRMKK